MTEQKQGEAKVFVVDGEDAVRLWAAVDRARAQFPERFAGMSDFDALDELIMLAQEKEASA